MKKELDVKDIKNNNQVFVFKANIPVEDANLLMDWDIICTQKEPIGFDSYRWKKIWHDHYFVKTYKYQIDEITNSIKELQSQMVKVLELLETKTKQKDDNSDLFK